MSGGPIPVQQLSRPLNPQNKKAPHAVEPFWEHNSPTYFVIGLESVIKSSEDSIILDTARDFLMKDQKGSKRLIAFFPWLLIDREVSIGSVKFVPFKGIGGLTSHLLTQLEAPLSKILSSYVDIKEKPVGNCTVIFIEERDLGWDLSREDHESVQWAASLLCLAAISQNRYFDSLGLGQYINSSAFQLYWQGFTKPAEYLSLQVRRRDGYTLNGGFRHGQTKFTVPVQARSHQSISINRAFVDAINNGMSASSRVLRQLKPALSFFLLANTDAEYMLPEAEVILTSSAFEQLLQAEGAYMLSCELGELFKKYEGISVRNALTNRPGIKLKENHKVQQLEWFVHRKWIEELHNLRSKYVHGEPITNRQWGWNPNEHLVMGAFAFPLTVKLLLSLEGYYSLNDNDEVRCRAVDKLLAAKKWTGEEGGRQEWQEILDETRRDISKRKKAEAFRRTFPRQPED